jgi:hypothetical protein
MIQDADCGRQGAASVPTWSPKSSAGLDEGRALARSVRLNAPLTLAYRAADAIGAVATFVELVTALAAESRSSSSIR